jgi:hypothetical protein
VKKLNKKEDETTIEFQPKANFKSPLKEDLDKGSFISFSKFSKYGLGVFAVAVTVYAVIQSLDIPIIGIPPERFGPGILALSLLILFLAVIIDILRWRDFTEWGAIGAMISYVGVFLIFMPLLLNTFVPFETVYIANISLYFMSIIAGIIIMIIGFTSHATELDRKLSEQWTIFIEWVKAGGIKQAISAFGAMIGTTIKGIGHYLAEGIKNLPKRVGKFVRLVIRGSKNVLRYALSFFQGVWNNIHWVGLIGLILLLFISDYNFYINIELLIIIGFFFSLGILYPNQDRVVNIVNRTSTFVLKQVVSTYSMLTGSKLRATDAVYCSRCLRGIERNEFESLVEIRGTENPPCPFCAYSHWISIYREPPIKEVIPLEKPPEKVITKDISRIRDSEEVVEKKEEIEESKEGMLASEDQIQLDSQELIEEGQKLAELDLEARKLYEWFFLQTKRYKESLISKSGYRGMIREYQNFLKKKSSTAQELRDQEPVKEEEIPTEDELKDDREIQVILETKVEIFIKRLVNINQGIFTSKELQEWFKWFQQQTESYKKSQFQADIYITMVERSRKFLLELDTKKLELDELKAYDELLTLFYEFFKEEE